MHDDEHSVVVIDPGSPAIGDQGKASSILVMTPSTLAVTLTTARWGGGPVAARRVPGCLLALVWVAAVAAFLAYAGILKLDFFCHLRYTGNPQRGERVRALHRRGTDRGGGSSRGAVSGVPHEFA
jgi:hypothetical protein